MALTLETEDDVHGGAWAHYRLTFPVDLLVPVAATEDEPATVETVTVDCHADFVVNDDGRVIDSRGDLAAHPDVFAAVARPNADDGRPRCPYFVLADGVTLPT